MLRAAVAWAPLVPRLFSTARRPSLKLYMGQPEKNAYDFLMKNARENAKKGGQTPKKGGQTPPSKRQRGQGSGRSQAAQPPQPAEATQPVQAQPVSAAQPASAPQPAPAAQPALAPQPAPAAQPTSAPQPAPAAGPSQPSVDEAIAALRSNNFDPKQAVFWKENEPVPFLFFARVVDMISNESGRNLITQILCNAYRTVIATRPEDLLPLVYLSANKIASSHEGIELGIGEAAIVKSMAEAYGRSEENVKNQLKTLGDLGLVAKNSRLSQRLFVQPPALTCCKVFEVFRAIAKESGEKSQEKKRGRIKALLVAANHCEPQYIIRLLQAKLRAGLAEQTVLAALAQAAVYSEQPPVPSSRLTARLEEAVQIMKETYVVCPIYEKIIPALLTEGISKLPEKCKFVPGVPIGPMLAKPTKGVTEILDKFQNVVFTSEYKYDGERAQIHYLEDGTVEIYSRNAERNTGKYPDVVSMIRRFKTPQVVTFVLDCEIVAYDRVKGKLLPFQTLSTRARKGVKQEDVTVQVCLFAFDLLYLDGKILLQEQLSTRRQLLCEAFQELPGECQFAKSIVSSDLDEMQTFLNDAINYGCEGLIIKTLEKEATYEPAKRSNNWLKLKKDYMDSLGDSVDLVPIGAFHGTGKRAGVYGAFLLACYDPDSGEYQSVCKIGTGFSEVDLVQRSESLRKHVISQPKVYYRYGSEKIDVWFDAVEVWEVKAADLTVSPVHKAAMGMVDPDKGISLRFPRLVRLREDKSPENATTTEQIVEMYLAQSNRERHSANDED